MGCCVFKVLGSARDMMKAGQDQQRRDTDEVKTLIKATAEERMKDSLRGVRNLLVEQDKRITPEFSKLLWAVQHSITESKEVAAKQHEEVKAEMSEIKDQLDRIYSMVQRGNYAAQMTQKLAAEATERAAGAENEAVESREVLDNLRAEILGEISTTSRAAMKQQDAAAEKINEEMRSERALNREEMATRIEEHRVAMCDEFRTQLAGAKTDARKAETARHKALEAEITRLLRIHAKEGRDHVATSLDTARKEIIEAGVEASHVAAGNRRDGESILHMKSYRYMNESLLTLREELCWDMGKIMRQHAVAPDPEKRVIRLAGLDRESFMPHKPPGPGEAGASKFVAAERKGMKGGFHDDVGLHVEDTR